MPHLADLYRAILAVLGQDLVEEPTDGWSEEARLLSWKDEFLTHRDDLVWMTVTRGAYRTKKALMRALDKSRIGYKPSALAYPEVELSKEKKDVDLVVCTPHLLLFRHEPSLREVYERAQQLGLELCPPEVAPLARLAYLEQPVREELFVAMRPIESDVPGIETPYPFIFSVAHKNRHDPIILDDPFALGETKKYPLDARFIFTLPSL